MTKMTSVYLFGGIGNNLFQISHALHLSNSGQKVQLISALTRPSLLTKILKWNVHPDDSLVAVLQNLHLPVKQNLNFLDIFWLVFIFVFYRRPIKAGGYKSKISNIHFGYFQSGDHLNQESLALLKPAINNDEILGTNGLVIHMRLGDFPNDQRLQPVYYSQALQELAANNKLPKDILVVSNDVEGARSLMETALSDVDTQSVKVDFVCQSANIDFQTMLKCKILIGSNSTFSLWAGLLGESELAYFPMHLSNGNKFVKFSPPLNIQLLEVPHCYC